MNSDTRCPSVERPDERRLASEDGANPHPVRFERAARLPASLRNALEAAVGVGAGTVRGPHPVVTASAAAQSALPRGVWQLPGMIDLHLHGGFGWDFAWGDSERIGRTLDAMLTLGLTGVVPTLITCPEEQRLRALADLAAVAARRRDPPEILGLYLEGPFLAPARRGSHPLELLQPPSVSALARWQDAAGGRIRLVTVAPELPGAFELLEPARRLGIRLALGHTDADHELASRAIAAGFTHVTHLFNAMRPFTHRDPTAVSAVLCDHRASVELIADGVHVHEPVMRLAVSLIGERLVLVSDGVCPLGLGDGEWPAYGTTLRVEGGVCTQSGQTQLFGGATPLPQALARLRRRRVVTSSALARAVGRAPAKVLGVEIPPETRVWLDADGGWLATETATGAWWSPTLGGERDSVMPPG